MKKLAFLFLLLGLTGCAGALRKENAVLKLQLEESRKWASDLKHDFDLCMHERGTLLQIYKEQGKKLADPKLKGK